jgi:predicted RNase H-like HicB family nuclease
MECGFLMAEQVIQFSLRVPAAVRQEGKWFYSSCPVLDVHSQGLSKEEALGNLIEALQLFVESCFERGTLDQVLRESGFSPVHQQRVVEGDSYLDVPVTLLAAKHVAENMRC